MPNYCENVITVTGSKEAIQLLIERIKKANNSDEYPSWGDRLFCQYKPMPSILFDTVSGALEHSYKDWVEAGRPSSFAQRDVVIHLDDIATSWDPKNENKTYREIFETYDKALATTEYTSWYRWAIDNWGTKWDVGGRWRSIEIWEPMNEEDLEDRIVFGCDTAWNPPFGFFEALLKSEGITDVSVIFYEQGCAFCGTWEDYTGKYFDVDKITKEQLEGELSDLDSWFMLREDIDRSSPLQFNPEVAPVLEGLGIEDCWDFDIQEVLLIKDALDGQKIEPGSIELLREGSGYPTGILFKGKKYLFNDIILNREEA